LPAPPLSVSLYGAAKMKPTGWRKERNEEEGCGFLNEKRRKKHGLEKKKKNKKKHGLERERPVCGPEKKEENKVKMG
jgi:hypothetical protein